jgi:hypothetical protein
MDDPIGALKVQTLASEVSEDQMIEPSPLKLGGQSSDGCRSGS